MFTRFACKCLLLILICQGLGYAGTTVTVDSHNRLMLNGKLWFPLGLSPGPPLGSKDPLGGDPMDVIKAAGMNSFRVGANMSDPAEVEANAKYLDWVAEHGMYAFPNLRELTAFDPKFPERNDQLRAIIERFKGHPAVAMWKIKDEPIPASEPPESLLASYRFIKELDPDHPVWLNHRGLGIRWWKQYRDTCDVSGIDVYPISVPMGLGSHIGNKEISCVGDFTQLISEAMDGKKPILMILQVGWSGASPPKHVRVFPTFHQERYMTYQAIIKGANGLLFFGSHDALEGRDAELGFNWTFWNEVLTPLMKEIGEGTELHQAILALPSKLPLKVKGAPDIEFTCREVGPYLYILAAKREGSPALIKFSGSFLKGQAEVMFENRHLDITNGKFTDRFERNDVHIYKLRRS